MKVSELTGAHLDYWVARADAEQGIENIGTICLDHMRNLGDTWRELWEMEDFRYQPSTDWAQGGPIIERERIELSPTGGGGNIWQAQCTGFPRGYFDGIWYGIGPTALIAAMRAYVASKFGDEVPGKIG